MAFPHACEGGRYRSRLRRTVPRHSSISGTMFGIPCLQEEHEIERKISTQKQRVYASSAYRRRRTHPSKVLYFSPCFDIERCGVPPSMIVIIHQFFNRMYTCASMDNGEHSACLESRKDSVSVSCSRCCCVYFAVVTTVTLHCCSADTNTLWPISCTPTRACITSGWRGYVGSVRMGDEGLA